MKMNSKKGFTLAELLVVVAIIAVLVAVAIPVLTNDLERSRDATSVANLRSAYAEAMVKYLNEGEKAVDSDGYVNITNVQLYGTKAGLEEGLADDLPFELNADWAKQIIEDTYTAKFDFRGENYVYCDLEKTG